MTEALTGTVPVPGSGIPDTQRESGRLGRGAGLLPDLLPNRPTPVVAMVTLRRIPS